MKTKMKYHAYTSVSIQQKYEKNAEVHQKTPNLFSQGAPCVTNEFQLMNYTRKLVGNKTITA